MANEVADEMIQYATDVCRKYNQIRTLAEDAEAAWRRNLEMVAESKYPVEEDMYKQEAEEGLVKYTAAREWIKLVIWYLNLHCLIILRATTQYLRRSL